MYKTKLLITGANGQIGSVLTTALRKRHGVEAVLASDIREPKEIDPNFVHLDITDTEGIKSIIKEHQITGIYHLAAILSAKGEQNPIRTWDLNMKGLLNVLEAARELKLKQVFFPSSIAVFGDKTPRQNTPQNTILNPSTIYGMSKRAGEFWCDYYNKKYNLDVRSLRFPGIIGYEGLAGGGTTDYAVDIFHYAIQHKNYVCFLSEHTRLPMMYMPDAIRAIIKLMNAPIENISRGTAYNLNAMDFTPIEIVTAIQKHLPDFKTTYEPDFRQAIADSWTDSIDDSLARNNWGWKEDYNLEAMVADMLKQLALQYTDDSTVKTS